MKVPMVWAALGVAVAAIAMSAELTKRDFESDAVGSPPAGFEFARTGGGAEGKWIVRLEKGGATNHVLAHSSIALLMAH